MYTLLIVEDETMERKALRKIISDEYGDKIRILNDAENGQEAIDKAEYYKPDIILMDIGLPVLNGLEAQEKIISFLPDVETVFITAYTDFTYAQRALQLKARDYLLKPLRKEMLINGLDKLIHDLDDRSFIKSTFTIETTEVCAVDKAITYMKNNFRDKVTLELIAEHVHLNAQYFSRLFKKETGISYIDYLNTLRINYSCKMLKSTSYPVYRVAVESGFTDPSYFSRVFAKYASLTPSEYRKSKATTDVLEYQIN